MRVVLAAAACMASLMIAAGAARAEDQCPKGNAPIFEEDLQAIPDCVAAHALHDACAWGSSGDAGLSGVVIPKCEAAFLPGLSRAQKRLYECARRPVRRQIRSRYEFDGDDAGVHVPGGTGGHLFPGRPQRRDHAAAALERACARHRLTKAGGSYSGT